MLGYLNPGSEMTLREGIKELRVAEGSEGDASQTLSEDFTPALDPHDAVHVLFGCETNLRGEIAAHIWMLFGTTITFREMHQTAKHQEHKSTLKEIGHSKLVHHWLGSLALAVKIIFRSIHMRKRWPIENLSADIDRKLNDIRREYGIKILQPKGAA
ncbi:MAG: hypothetical protein AB4426_06230 [Xenococcaceae cyanobacterium]